MDRVLRRSLGVSETAQADSTVKPAPPVDPELPQDEPEPNPYDFELPADDDGKAKVILSDELKDQISIEMEEIPDDDPIHDEL